MHTRRMGEREKEQCGILMKPFKQADNVKIDPTEADLSLMNVIENAFMASRRIKSNLKSLKSDIAPLIDVLVDQDKALSNLENLFSELSVPSVAPHRYRSGAYTNTSPMDNIKTFLAALLVSAIKNDNNRNGKSEPVYEEEVEWMMKKACTGATTNFGKCAKPAGGV